MKRLDLLLLLLLAVGCDGFTDPATRLAADLEAASNRLGGVAGAAYTASHRTPSKAEMSDWSSGSMTSGTTTTVCNFSWFG